MSVTTAHEATAPENTCITCGQPIERDWFGWKHFHTKAVCCITWDYRDYRDENGKLATAAPADT